MKSSAIKYCTSCGENVIDSSEKCICGKYPYGDDNDILTEEESGLDLEQQLILRYQYCLNCGEKVKGENEKDYYFCPSCGKNPVRLNHKQLRVEITINYCENCGKGVQDRDTVCSCGRLPYYFDNFKSNWDMDKIEKMSFKEFEEFISKDSDNMEIDKHEIKYCKECGFNHNNDNKYDFVDEETGEVYVKCPQCK